MPNFRSFNDISLSYIEFLRLVQPLLSTSPGTVVRDMLDANSQQLANLYTELRNIYGLQSLFAASGTDLNNLASNFNLKRSQGSSSTGTAVFTTNVLTSDILIPQNTIVTARNGVTYNTTIASTMFAASANVYKATATTIGTQLALASITDQYAIEIPVEALSPGVSGNIGPYSLSSQNIPGIANVTNISSFSGGTDQESDNAFRNRILSIFAGSNTGTSLGYITTVEAISGVTAAITIGPGNPLMTRDGTQTTTDAYGNTVITSEGTGGKVDLYILGQNLVNNVDTYIYTDQSGRGITIDPANDFILGQNGQSTTTNVQQRRVQLIASGTLPNQPVDSIISVSGSLSGNNFAEQYTDTDGTLKGNYILEKDTGAYSGSPFGFDKLHWTSNEIDLSAESDVKGVFNGQDPLNFTEVEDISLITQNVLITNENSKVISSDRSMIQLKHTPATNVTRAANLTTGERYVIQNQNTNGTAGTNNTTGVITISGNTLPVLTDVLQVDYTWVKPFDRVFDYDNLQDINTLRTVQDSVDWGFGNLVRDEPAVATVDAYGNYNLTVTNNISKVIDVLTVVVENSVVNSGTIVMSQSVNNVLSIKRISDEAELYNTDNYNGSISGNTIILPTDTLAQDTNAVIVNYNTVNVYSDGGTFTNNIITFPVGSGVADGYDGYSFLVDYVANVSTLLPATNLTSLPATQSQNNILINGVASGVEPTSNLYDAYGNVIQNLRRAATNVQVDCENIGGPGSIALYGTTFNLVQGVQTVVLSGDGYTIDLTSAIKTFLNTTTLPTSISVAKLYSVEKLKLNNEKLITAVEATYDIQNYQIQNNSYDLIKGLENSTLNKLFVKLPATQNNIQNLLNTGDVIRVTFYYINNNDSESLYYSRNGIQTTQKVFSSLTNVSVLNGFQNPKGIVQGNITLSNFNQPASGTSYNTSYSYIAPKQNERITINYNTNSLIDTATFAIEAVRPITADVLVREAQSIPINVTANITLQSQYSSQQTTVQQNVISALDTYLNSSSLGTTVYLSNVYSIISAVSGVNSVIILNLGTTASGNSPSVSAAQNQYLTAGNVIINVVSN